MGELLMKLDKESTSVLILLDCSINICGILLDHLVGVIWALVYGGSFILVRLCPESEAGSL